MALMKHNHITRDIKEYGQCGACDEYHIGQLKEELVDRFVESVDNGQLDKYLILLEDRIIRRRLTAKIFRNPADSPKEDVDIEADV